MPRCTAPSFPDRLLLVNTPTRFNSETTKHLAADLAERLGSPYVTVPIGDFVDRTAEVLASLTIRTAEGSKIWRPRPS